MGIHQALLMSSDGGGGPSSSTNVLAAQVLDVEKEESASDVGLSPDNLMIEVFN